MGRHLVADALDVLGGQALEGNVSDRGEVDEGGLIAAQRIGADGGSGALNEPSSEVGANAEPRQTPARPFRLPSSAQLPARLRLRLGRLRLVPPLASRAERELGDPAPSAARLNTLPSPAMRRLPIC